MLLGVRRPLVAFNVELESGDLETARAIAAAIRERDGGLPGVQAIGLVLQSSGRAQVSTNLIDIEATPLPGAGRTHRGAGGGARRAVAGSELVGLMPAGVAARAAGDVLRLPGMAADRMLEVAVSGEFE